MDEYDWRGPVKCRFPDRRRIRDDFLFCCKLTLQTEHCYFPRCAMTPKVNARHKQQCVRPVELRELSILPDEFGRNCTSSSSETYYHGDVNETRQFDVTYRGRALKYYCASIGFKGSGKGESLRDEYKVCVTPRFFNDPGCAVQLNFTDDVYAETLQTIDCLNNNVTKFCNGQDKYLYIDFEFLNESELSRANFKLLVTAEKVYKYEESSDALVYGIVGAVIGVIIIVIIAGSRIPAASQCPSEYARIPAAYIHPPEYSWRPAAAYGLPGDVQTPAARYNLQEFVAPPTSYHNPTTWSRPRYKDLHFDWRSSWKPFLHMFVRLSRSQRWTETEQHDQFCFFLEGTASEYYTLLLETSPDLRFADILRKFDKRLCSAAPDLAHQLNFQPAVQNSGPRTGQCFRCGKTGHFRKECPAVLRRKAEVSAGEVVDHSLRSRGACQGVADEETKTCSQAPSGQLHTVSLLTQDEKTSFRKHPADDLCVVDKDAPCPNIRRRRKRGRRRRRMRHRRPNLLKSFSTDPDVPEEEVTPVVSNCRLKVLSSKVVPTESKCPEAKVKDDIVGDSWPPTQAENTSKQS
uniref:Uncharacterized protein n=1 Tax=Magallana gigas TaxID=29159 RepID=K1Q2B9_MAGGI